MGCSVQGVQLSSEVWALLAGTFIERVSRPVSEYESWVKVGMFKLELQQTGLSADSGFSQVCSVSTLPTET